MNQETRDEKCPACNGTGWNADYDDSVDAHREEDLTVYYCERCKGTGRADQTPRPTLGDELANGIRTAIVILCALCVSSSFARIGETEAQIEKRYGKALSSSSGPGTPVFLYRKNSMQIGVVFIKGKSVAEFYSHVDKSSLSENEMNLLLEANSFNGTWKKSDGMPMWELEPSGYTATYRGGSFVVTTPEFIAMSKDEREKAEAAKLKNF